MTGDHDAMDDAGAAGDMNVPDVTAQLIQRLAQRGLTIAAAESLTGGLLTAELTRVPGSSAVVVGGVVAYATEIKHAVLGVEPRTLALHGPVHPDVAVQMATGVRRALAVDRPVSVGISTTGVAGPDPQGGQPPGVVFLGISVNTEVHAIALTLSGTRDEIRRATVERAIIELDRVLASVL